MRKYEFVVLLCISALVLGVVMAVGFFLERTTDKTISMEWGDNHDVLFQATKHAYESWSWSASLPLDFIILDPEGKKIKELVSQTATEGKFFANMTGTYHFLFTPNTYQKVELTYHISYIPGKLIAGLFIVGISLIVLIVTNTIFTFIKKRKKDLPEQEPNEPQSHESKQSAPIPPPPSAPSPTMSPEPSSRPRKPMVKGRTSYCAACGFENLDGARYCSSCGKPL